jgi:hypothetical protein
LSVNNYQRYRYILKNKKSANIVKGKSNARMWEKRMKERKYREGTGPGKEKSLYWSAMKEVKWITF